MEFRSFSESGSGHPKNEDCILRELHPSGQDRHLFFLADGQGGRADGAAAARAACEGGLTAARDFRWEELASPSTWDEIFSAADLNVRDSCGGFTTLIGIACDRERVFGASAGDSKVFYRPLGSKATELSERQVKNPPLGAGCNRATFFSILDFQGTLLVVSDGVWKYAGFESLARSMEMEEIDQIPPNLRKVIISQQKSDNLPDDFSVIMIRS